MTPEEAKEIEARIDRDEYTMIDKLIYGGFVSGYLVLPTNILKIICTIIFPPLGIIVNEIIDELKENRLMKFFYIIDKIIYSIILTMFFYFPGLIYSLSQISRPTPQFEEERDKQINIGDKLSEETKDFGL